MDTLNVVQTRPARKRPKAQHNQRYSDMIHKVYDREYLHSQLLIAASEIYTNHPTYFSGPKEALASAARTLWHYSLANPHMGDPYEVQLAIKSIVPNLV